MIVRALLAAALPLGAAIVAPALAAAQPSPVPPPVPPAPPAPGTAWFDRARADYIDKLRRSCLSEKGVTIAVEHWTRWHAAGDQRLGRERAVRQELGEAALTAPVDLVRLERALAADAAAQAEFRTALNENSMTVMRLLSPSDRAIFARRLTVMSPASPPPACIGK